MQTHQLLQLEMFENPEKTDQISKRTGVTAIDTVGSGPNHRRNRPQLRAVPAQKARYALLKLQQLKHH